MKTLIISLIVLLSSLFLLSSPAYAVNVFGTPCGSAAGANTDVCRSANSENASGANPIVNTLKVVINVLSYIIGIASVIVLIVAGFQFITGGSDPQSVTNARNTLTYALVGIAVTVFARLIVAFVLDRVFNA